MPKKKRPRCGASGWSTLPWDSVDATIPAPPSSFNSKKKRGQQQPPSNPSNTNHDDDDHPHQSDDEGYNHYDDPKADPSDLYGAEDGFHEPGIFLGLEVLDGNAYEVERVELKGGGSVTRVLPRTKKVDPEGEMRKDAGNCVERGKADEIPPSIGENECKKSTDGQGSSRKEQPSKEQPSEEDEELSKKERRKLKRKAKRQAAKERKKRLKMEKRIDEKDGGGSDADAAKLTNKKDEGAADEGDDGRTNTKPDDTAPSPTPPPPPPPPTADQIVQIRSSWSHALNLHPHLCAALHRCNFVNPTPIQSATLPAAILGRRDIVGAAPTGSGKTLCYALPVLQGLLLGEEEREGLWYEEDEESSEKALLTTKRGKTNLGALILCPTRELALQVTSEFNKLSSSTKIKCGTIVGGLSEQKQRRVLEKVKPEVLVATPGRLWDLMSSNTYPHLQNLTRLRFLVIDEADRMINQGSFPQLTQIFDAINRANPKNVDETDDDEEDTDEEDDDDENRLRSLKGVRGEAKVTMLDEKLLAMIERQKKGEEDSGGKDGDDDDDDGSDHDGGDWKGKDDTDEEEEEVCPVPEPVELDDDEFEEQRLLLEKKQGEEDSGAEEGDDDEEDDEVPVHRQTFVFSATLTLPPSPLYAAKESGRNNSHKAKKKRKTQTVEGAIAEILDRAAAMGQTKVVDLTSSLSRDGKVTTKSKKAPNEKDTSQKKNKKKQAADDAVKSTTRLPPGLTLYQIRCTQKHKDSHLYAYLATTRQGSSGPCLVFCNSIAAVRRVGETLKMLGLSVRTLHAKMAQKSRFTALESIREPKSRSVVIATDVAARGLDIPSVSTVVHYDVARAVDTFIHRAGRTARGVGEHAVGVSLSLVAPSEEKAHKQICDSLRASGRFSDDPIDGRLLSAAQERTALASKIVACEEVESKVAKNNNWFKNAASDAGLDLDEDLLDEGLLGGDSRDRQKLAEAQQARAELRELLSRPIRKQNFGKFLSGVGISEAVRAEAEVTPHVVPKKRTVAKSRTRKSRNRK